MKKINSLKILRVNYWRDCESQEIVEAEVEFKVGNVTAKIDIETYDYLTDMKAVENEIVEAIELSLESEYFELISIENDTITFDLLLLHDCEIKYDDCQEFDENVIEVICRIALEDTFTDKYDQFGFENCNCRCRECDYEFDCRRFRASEDFIEIRQHEIDKEMIEDILEGSSDEFIQATIDRVNYPESSNLDAEEIYECLLKVIKTEKSVMTMFKRFI